MHPVVDLKNIPLNSKPQQTQTPLQDFMISLLGQNPNMIPNCDLHNYHDSHNPLHLDQNLHRNSHNSHYFDQP
ncbi:hypothetical protein Peur_068807 [Populus x canadensis]